MTAILTFLKLNWKSILPGVLIVMALGYHFLTVNSLKKKHEKVVANYETTLNDLNIKNLKLLNENLVLDNNIKSLNVTITDLTKNVEANNETIEKMRVDEASLRQEIAKWKNQKPVEVIKYIDKIVYVKDKKNITLDDCKRINQNIANIKYKDL